MKGLINKRHVTKPIDTCLWAFVLFLLSSPSYADSGQHIESETAYQWNLMYQACLEKTGSMPELVSMKQLLKSGQVPPSDAVEVKSGIEDIEVMFQQYCQCIKAKAAEGFQLAGYDITPLEVSLLSAAFRFETLYPDKQVRELFGVSTLSCLNL
jgi:hypothetical protein